MSDPWCCPNLWACHNHVRHDAPFGCVHWSTSGIPDRHEKGDDE